ncbi:MAG: hypothetical protein H7839_21430 [Magnetococcus sp. YQC-5]
MLEEIEAELKWDKTFTDTQSQLANMADQAFDDFRSGRVRKMGFDEL